MRLRLGLLPPLILLPLTLAHAERFRSFEERTKRPPVSMTEITQEIEFINQNISTVQCGGWLDAGALKTDTLADIATPEDTSVPGFANKPFDALKTGGGVRGGYRYPSNAYGYASACWMYDEALNPDQLCMIGPLKATPKECKDLHDKIQKKKETAGRPLDCGIPRHQCFDFSGICEGQDCRCGLKFRCEIWTPGTLISIKNVRDLQAYGCALVPATPNADGECIPEFNYDGPSCVLGPAGEIIIVSPAVYYGVIAPYYRHYGLQPDEDKTKFPANLATLRGFAINSEGQTQRAAAECYEYPFVKDALTSVAQDREDRCEIYETKQSDGDPPVWKTLSQKGEVRPNGGMSPYTPDELDPSRPDRTVELPWVKDDKTNLTLLDMDKVRELRENADDREEISDYLAVVHPEQRIAAITTQGIRADSFDDTTNAEGTSAEQRAFVQWWQRQQSVLTDIMQPPTVRIILPASYATGFDPNDPLLHFAGQGISTMDGTVEMEVRAGDGLLGSVFSALASSVTLPVQEVRVPVVVPLATDLELDALIHEWQQWEVRNGKQGAAEGVIAKLNSYKEQTQKVRLLRSSLATTTTQLLSSQQELRQFFADWYKRNVQTIAAWDSGADARKKVAEAWRDVAKEFLRIHDDCELKWCSNARFTLPVYSLLDTWLPDRPSLTSFVDNPDYNLTAPGTSHFPRTPDVTADFSAFSLSSDSISVPVLDVTQVRLDLPEPKDGVNPPDLSTMPDIPHIPDELLIPEVHIFDDITLPDISTPDDAMSLPPSPPQNFDGIVEKLNSIKEVVKHAGDTYCAFRSSTTGGAPLYPRVPPQASSESSEEAEGRHSNEQWRRIVHTEYDLRERVSRLFARRLPLVKQDYRGRVERLGGVAPRCTNDVICTTLEPERMLSFTWQLKANVQEQTFEEVTNEVKDAVRPESEEKNPYLQSLDVLQRIFYPLSKPPSVDLFPSSASSVSP